MKGVYMVGFIKTFDQYPHIFYFGLFRSLLKRQEDLNMKFRSKFNHGLTNYGYLHCVILKALYIFKVKNALEARESQFLVQNIPKQLEIRLKQSVELTQKLTTVTTAPHS